MYAAILQFWFQEVSPAQWWKVDAAFDRLIAESRQRGIKVLIADQHQLARIGADHPRIEFDPAVGFRGRVQRAHWGGS